jgi:hypothetical protein
MSPRRRSAGPPDDTPDGLERAFDAVNFGAERTLNLRAHMPTRSEALVRARHGCARSRWPASTRCW